MICSVCKNENPDNLKNCIHCGSPLQNACKNKSNTVIIAIIIVLAVAFLAIAGIWAFDRFGGAKGGVADNNTGDFTAAFTQAENTTNQEIQYEYQKWMGNWFHPRNSDAKPKDYDAMTFVDKGSYKATLFYSNGKAENITFITDTIAYGKEKVLKECMLEGDKELKHNVKVRNVFEFKLYNGEQQMYVCQRAVDTNQLVVAEWQTALRKIPRG